MERQANPADRRGVRVRLTQQGGETVTAAMADLVAFERGVLDALTPLTRRQLAASLRTLLAGFEAPAQD